MGIRAVLAKIAGSEEIEQNAKIEPKPTQVTTPVTEDLAENAPARPQTDEVARILAVWRRLGIKNLDELRVRQGLEPVGEHLANLSAGRRVSRKSAGVTQRWRFTNEKHQA